MNEALLKSNEGLKKRNRKLSKRNKLLRDLIHHMLDNPDKVKKEKQKILDFIQGDEEFYFDEKKDMLKYLKQKALKRLNS